MGAGTTKSGPKGWSHWLALTGITATSLALPLIWVQQRVAHQIATETRQAWTMRIEWMTDARRARALVRQWQQEVARTEAADQQRKALLAQLAQVQHDILAKETAINQLAAQIDRLTGSAPIPLLPSSPTLTPKSIPSGSLPTLPSSPPPVHTVTGSSGMP